MESLLTAGVKVHDFVYEPIPNANKTPKVFDLVPCLISADWHMRNPHKNFSLLIPKSLFRLIKMGWLSMANVRLNLHPHKYTTLTQYNKHPNEQLNPSIIMPLNQSILTPSQHVKFQVMPPSRSVQIQTMLPIASLSDMTRTLQVCRTTKGRVGLLDSSLPLINDK